MMMKKQYYILYIIMCALLVTGCSEEDFFGQDSLTKEQRALIGRAVNFNPSMAETFQTRYTQYHDGRFNEGDLMQIYRQYWDGSKGEWEATQAFRTYVYDVTYATGTSINLSTDWKVAYKPGTSSVDRMKCDDWDPIEKTGTLVVQDKSDSITWENGTTVRFRAWSRSNVTDCLKNGSASAYYPDFCIADWVTVSGPTQGIPLTLRHLCSRVRFTPKSGNQFYSAEICLDKEAYQWDDNADSYDKDENDKLSSDEADKVVKEVNELFNRLCMPAGVDIESGTLRTMTQYLYTRMSTEGDALYKTFNVIEQRTKDEGIVDYGEKTADYIKDEVQHPKFSSVDGYLNMITIPYDMSSDADKQGEVLTIPAKTRFRIKLRDVNNGDAAGTSGYEAKEHIFSLSDITKKDKDGNDVQAYPNGLPLTPGHSYTFTVGYQYDQLSVTVIEEGINWIPAGSEEGEATNQHVTENHTDKYQWYQKGIKDAVKDAISKTGIDYNPIFTISTAEEFKEFIDLVNGTNIKTSGLERALRDKDNPDADSELDNKTTRRYWWYDVEKTAASLASEFPDTVWVTRAEAELQGYVFYRRYYPQISSTSAYSIEDYVRGPVSFYDEQVDLHLVVQLANDIDLHDWQLESIGKASNTPFKGFFDGGTHTLSNVNVNGEYLFGFMEDGEIRDLRLTSTHKLALLNEGRTSRSTRNIRIVGVSLQADCTNSPIAKTLTGDSYVVGCIHEGDAGGAIVGTANQLTMYGCMHASTNLTGAALLGSYASGVEPFFAPQDPEAKLVWTNFMCNYYQKTPTQATNAVGNVVDKYRPQEYIRGARQHILRAKNDNMLDDETPYDKLKTDTQKENFYGLAPWKAMNYAIYQYNKMEVATTSEYKSYQESHQCHMMYQVDDIGYAHRYPLLVACPNGDDGKPGVTTDQGVKNILLLNN